MKTLFYLIGLGVGLILTSHNTVVENNEFIDLVDTKTYLMTKMIEFEDKALLEDIFSGSFNGTQKEIDEILALDVFGYNDMETAYSDFNWMSATMSKLVKEKNGFDEQRLEAEINKKVVLKLLLNPEVEACNNAAGACHSACNHGGGSGIGLIGAYGCHMYCEGQRLVCVTNATLNGIQ